MKTFSFLILCSLLLAGIYGYMPYSALANLTTALEDEKPSAVANYVDFDALKQFIEQDFTTPKKGNLGEEIINNLTRVVVKRIVSPETMVFVLKDKNRRESLGFERDLATLLKRSHWKNPNQVTFQNAQGETTLQMTREGAAWKLTGIHL